MADTESMMTGVVRENHQIAPDHFLMKILLPSSFPSPVAGQFVMVRAADRMEPLLARPLSVYGFQKQGGHAVLELLYRVTGRGTALFSKMKADDEVVLIGPLGNGFTVPSGLRRAIFVAGGVGVAPLIFLLRELCRAAKTPQGMERIFYLGARSRELLIGLDRLDGSCDLKLCTDDGSEGYQGLVTQRLREEIVQYDPKETVVFSCGPTPMVHALRQVVEENPIPCQVSIEERMACGLGACLGCVVEVQGPGGGREYVRVCREGPVFDLTKIWERKK